MTPRPAPPLPGDAHAQLEAATVEVITATVTLLRHLTPTSWTPRERIDAWMTLNDAVNRALDTLRYPRVGG